MWGMRLSCVWLYLVLLFHIGESPALIFLYSAGCPYDTLGMGIEKRALPFPGPSAPGPRPPFAGPSGKVGHLRINARAQTTTLMLSPSFDGDCIFRNPGARKMPKGRDRTNNANNTLLVHARTGCATEITPAERMRANTTHVCMHVRAYPLAK